MEQDNSEAAKEANRHFQKAVALTRDALILHENQGCPPPNLWMRFKLKRAAKLLQRVLCLFPHHWNSMWILGKIVQRLGDERAAFDWFVKAWDENPRNIDVAREASLSAMHLGLSRHAVEYCEEALGLQPNNAGLVCNLALAFLHDGQPQRAMETAERAFALDPEDKVSKNVLRVTRHILETKSPCPTTGAELDAYCKKHRDIFRQGN